MTARTSTTTSKGRKRESFRFPGGGPDLGGGEEVPSLPEALVYHSRTFLFFSTSEANSPSGRTPG
ncbi:hypothetical protein LCGC14_3137390, partial [marine sediment metagenome]